MNDAKKITYSGYSFIALFVVLISAIMYFTLGHIKQLSLKQTGESISTVLTSVQSAHHLWIDQRLKDASEFAARPNVVSMTIQLIDKYNRGDEIIGSLLLEDMRATVKGYLKKSGDQGFFLIASDYISLGSMRDININTPNLIYQQKKSLLDQSFQGETVFIPTIISDVPLSVNSNHEYYPPTMFITTPIRSQGVVIAVLAIRIDPAKHFTRITQLGRFSNSGETYAFDDRGIIITNSRFDQDLRLAGLIESDQNSILNIRITDPGGNLLTGYRSSVKSRKLPLTLMAQSAITGQNGLNIKGYRDYRGVTVVGAWLWEKEYGFGITTEVDLEEALITYYNVRNTLFTVAILVCALGFILSGFIQRMDRVNSKHLKEAYDGLEVRVIERNLELEVAKRLLSKANSELSELAITDGLTGLHNRRHFDEHLNNEWRRCMREKKRLAIIIFDVDFFKAYNDFYGHQLGDECLQQIGRKLMEMKLSERPGDIVARYGGEEFVICCSDTTDAYAKKTAETIRQEITRLSIRHQKTEIESVDYVTVSVGVAIEEARHENSVEKLINKADKALYEAKNNGRNKVCTREP